MPNPAIRFGWSSDSRTAPSTWTAGEWLTLTSATASSLHDEPRLHVSTRERVYVRGIRAWVNGEPQDSSVAVVTVAPASMGLLSGDGGRDRAWWLWVDVIGVLERPVRPLGVVKVYGSTPTP